MGAFFSRVRLRDGAAPDEKIVWLAGDGEVTHLRTQQPASLVVPITGKLEVEKHLRHCPICSEAVAGFKGHQHADILKSDIEYLSGRIRKRYASTRRGNQQLPVMIAFSVFVSLIILLIILYIMREFLTNL